MTMHFIQRDGVRLAYELRGPMDGPLIALIQGLGLAGRMWLDLPHGLTRMGYRVVIPDNRGTGASDAPWPPYAITTMADDAAAVLEDVGRGRRLIGARTQSIGWWAAAIQLVGTVAFNVK